MFILTRSIWSEVILSLPEQGEYHRSQDLNTLHDQSLHSTTTTTTTTQGCRAWYTVPLTPAGSKVQTGTLTGWRRCLPSVWECLPGLCTSEEIVNTPGTLLALPPVNMSTYPDELGLGTSRGRKARGGTPVNLGRSWSRNNLCNDNGTW